MNVKPLGPVAGAYYLDNSRVAVILGPVGSGKSTGSCLRLGRHSYEQWPMQDGVARTRWAIVRNTKGQLKDTTIKTWLQVYPEAQYGEFRTTAMSQTWKFKPKGWDYPIEAEFLFRALDDEADVANMLSLELTGFYFNECREIDEQIIVHAGRRSGRFPSVADGGCRWAGWIGDSNPWDVEHYMYRDLTEGGKPDWKLFRQPGGMDAAAENRENLPVNYYEDAVKDYGKEDADVYVHAKYGRTKSGKPIYTDYSDHMHCKPFELSPALPLRLGLDFGRTPAVVISQQMASGAWRVRHELCGFDIGVQKFGGEVRRFLNEHCGELPIAQITGDPAGSAKDGSENTAFDLLKGASLIAKPANTNELSTRIEVVNAAFRRISDGEPGLLIHPECKMLRRACIDGYRYRKLNVMGNRYAEDPDKNEWSHVAEALQYLLLGGGEAKVIMPRSRKSGDLPKYAIT
jgi:hypothetical protein